MGRAGVERAVRLAEPFNPDLVVLTGDFVSHPFPQTKWSCGSTPREPCADVLATIKAQTLAILGNHDHWNDADIVHAVLKERASTSCETKRSAGAREEPHLGFWS